MFTARLCVMLPMSEVDGGSMFIASVVTRTSSDCSHYCYRDDACDLATFYNYKGVGMCYIYKRESFQHRIGGTEFTTFGKACRGKESLEIVLS